MKRRSQTPGKILDGFFERARRSSKLPQEHLDLSRSRAWTRLGSEPEYILVEPLALPLKVHRRPLPVLRALLAAAVAVAVFVGAFLMLRGRAIAENVDSGEKIEAGHIVRTDASDAVLKLADLSRIEMRSASELSLDRAEDGIRIVLSRGGIIVNAAKQKNGHLYVQTKDVTVSVVGTVFLVNTEEMGSRVGVIEGEVAVQNVRQAAVSEKLSAGEQVTTAPAMEPSLVVEEISWSRNATTHLALLQQSTAAIPTVRREFEVASIKPYDRNSIGSRNSPEYGQRGINFGGVSLGFIIGEAYKFPVGRIIGPGSLTKESLWSSLSQGYDIVANAEHAVSKDELRLMLQSLLADRFKLKLHRESKLAPAYQLVLGKDGPKFEESKDDGVLLMDLGKEGFVFRNAEMMRLAGMLSGRLDRIVVDQTSLNGLYNFTLKMPADLLSQPNSKSEGLSPDSPSASVFSNSLKELGLQLVSARVPVEYLVVDSLEKPSEN